MEAEGINHQLPFLRPRQDHLIKEKSSCRTDRASLASHVTRSLSRRSTRQFSVSAPDDYCYGIHHSKCATLRITFMKRQHASSWASRSGSGIAKTSDSLTRSSSQTADTDASRNQLWSETAMFARGSSSTDSRDAQPHSIPPGIASWDCRIDHDAVLGADAPRPSKCRSLAARALSGRDRQA
jgi:hypothetical protein